MLGGEEPDGKNISDAHYSGSKVTRPKKKLKKLRCENKTRIPLKSGRAL